MAVVIADTVNSVTKMTYINNDLKGELMCTR